MAQPDAAPRDGGATSLPPLHMRRDALSTTAELRQIRETVGVREFTNAFGMQVYLVTRHEDIKAVLSDHERFSNERPPGFAVQGVPQPTEEEQATARAGNLLGLDPPEHSRLRRMLTPEFTGCTAVCRTNAGGDAQFSHYNLMSTADPTTTLDDDSMRAVASKAYGGGHSTMTKGDVRAYGKHSEAVRATVVGYRRAGRWEFWAQLRESKASGEQIRAVTLSVGNPQCVLLGGPLLETRLHKLGPALEHHPHFPNRTNVSFASVEAPGRVRILIVACDRTPPSGPGGLSGARDVVPQTPRVNLMGAMTNSRLPPSSAHGRFAAPCQTPLRTSFRPPAPS